MTKDQKRLTILSTAIIAVGILLDQLTKWLAVRYLMPLWPDSVHLIPGVVDLTYAENPGAAFGMLEGHRWVFMTVSTVAILAMGVYLFTLKERKDTLAAVSLAMIVSGGIGNMIDRVALGYVVDFIDVNPLFPFAIFNGADSFVCVGAALLVLAFLLEWKREIKAEKAKEQATSGDTEP